MSVLGDAWGYFTEQRDLLVALVNAAAELAQALSGRRLRTITSVSSPADLEAWRQEYETAAIAGNGPPLDTWIGGSRMSAAAPWPILLARYATREPGIANALLRASQAYSAIAQSGNIALRNALTDGPLRTWAEARLGREQATGPGSQLGAMPLADDGDAGMGKVLLVLALLAAAKGAKRLL
jgi:hypothetical protein